jgi:nickel-dependent lactate racemase
MLYYARGSETENISRNEMEESLGEVFREIGKSRKVGAPSKVLAIPPDISGMRSRAGDIINFASRYYREKLTDILPALSVRAPMTDGDIDKMFGNIQHSLFRVHDRQKDLVSLGSVPASYVEKVSGGRVVCDWPVEVNKFLVRGGYGLILAAGQAAPHEVTGISGCAENIFFGAGGQEGINRIRFLGAVYGMEKIMGRRDNPVRNVLDYAAREFARDLPILYVLTVIGQDAGKKDVLRGLYAGDDEECYTRAAELAARINVVRFPNPLRKVVVYLNPDEFHDTWLGNISVYRTRMAIAEGGELLVLAPGLKEFGEDKTIDALIRKYGYRGTPETLRAVEKNAELKANFFAAAHLICGSPEGRFTVTCCPGRLSREEIESVGFRYDDIGKMMARYSPERLKDGWNTLPDGEEIYYISNPASGLWAWEKKFKENENDEKR